MPAANLPITPNWPYDLSQEQQNQWEQAICADIQSTCARINALIIPRIKAKLAEALGES